MTPAHLVAVRHTDEDTYIAAPIRRSEVTRAMIITADITGVFRLIGATG